LHTALAAMRDGRLRVETVTAERVGNTDDPGFKAYELVVTVGLSAAKAVAARTTALSPAPPTLCLLIPRQGYESLTTTTRVDARGRQLSAVFIDQPISRQLDLVRIALPNRKRAAVVLGPTSNALKNELRDRARERELALEVVEIAESSGVYSALQQLLPASDLLLAVADPIVFNPSTVYGLLLTTYRAQLPVVGFSEGLVKAGALFGLFSTARQVGKQGGEIASRLLSGEATLPAPQYPKYFTVRVNGSVARSLGISIEEEATLAAQLGAMNDSARDGRRPAPGTPAAPGKSR
jgi:putative ABC transport system substrate-binding protein